MVLQNIWNNVVDWFHNLSDRSKLVREFNNSAKSSFILGNAPTLLKASVSHGCREYKHQFSAWNNTGFRIQALSGRPLSKNEMTFIGNVILSNVELVRHLVALGWDTLEIHDDSGFYGLRWKLINYINMGGLLDEK